MSMKKKFIIATTIPATFVFFRGNLRYLSRWFDVCAVSSDPVNLTAVGERENVRTYCVPMTRSISILRDFCCLIVFIRFLLHEWPYIVHGNTPKASMLSMLASKLVGVPKRIYMCHGLRYQGSKGIMRDLGLEDFVLNIDELHDNSIIECFIALEKRKDEYLRKLENAKNEIANQREALLLTIVRRMYNTKMA